MPLRKLGAERRIRPAPVGVCKHCYGLRKGPKTSLSINDPFKPLGMPKHFPRPDRRGNQESYTVSHRSTTAVGRNWCPNSSLRDLIWTGWSGGQAVPGDLGLRRPRWRWMFGLTVNTSAELCSPIALKSHRGAFWSPCPPQSGGCGRFNFDDMPIFPKCEGREREKPRGGCWEGSIIGSGRVREWEP